MLLDDLAAWGRIKNSQNIDDWVQYLREFPNGRFAEIAQVRLARMLAEIAKPSPAAPSAVPAGEVRAEKPALELKSDIPQQLIPAELQVGRKWAAGWILQHPKWGKLVLDFECQIEALEEIVVPAGRFKAFRVHALGWIRNAGDRLDWTRWIDSGINGSIRLDALSRNRFGHMTTTIRWELVSLVQHAFEQGCSVQTAGRTRTLQVSKDCLGRSSSNSVEAGKAGFVVKLSARGKFRREADGCLGSKLANGHEHLAVFILRLHRRRIVSATAAGEDSRVKDPHPGLYAVRHIGHANDHCAMRAVECMAACCQRLLQGQVRRIQAPDLVLEHRDEARRAPGPQGFRQANHCWHNTPGLTVRAISALQPVRASVPPA